MFSDLSSQIWKTIQRYHQSTHSYPDLTPELRPPPLDSSAAEAPVKERRILEQKKTKLSESRDHWGFMYFVCELQRKPKGFANVMKMSNLTFSFFIIFRYFFIWEMINVFDSIYV